MIAVLARARRWASSTNPFREPFVSTILLGGTSNHSAMSDRSGVYPAPEPYERIVRPSRSMTVRAHSASSSTGRHSGDVGAVRGRDPVEDDADRRHPPHPAVLADDDHDAPAAVPVEALDDADPPRAADRTAADAVHGQVAEAELGQLVAALIGERAR